MSNYLRYFNISISTAFGLTSTIHSAVTDTDLILCNGECWRFCTM